MRAASSGPKHRRPSRRRTAALAAAAAVLLLAAAAGLAAVIHSGGGVACSSSQRTFVPAYFYASSTWKQATQSRPRPGYLILDISGTGAGSAPDPHFRAVVRQAQAAGIAVLGYSSTAGGSRPLSAVEQDVRHYRAWYGVRNIFLDVVHAVGSELPYYRALTGYVHRADPGSSVWLNPGTYPDQSYMSLGTVVVTFEGPYASYRRLHVPDWVSHYPTGRFADTVYATPASRLSAAIALSRRYHARYAYVTDGTGPNPYGALPAYWSREAAAVSSGCAS